MTTKGLSNKMGRGLLVFKGEKPKKKKKKSKHDRHDDAAGAAASTAEESSSFLPPPAAADVERKPAPVEPPVPAPTPAVMTPTIRTGRGTITTSGTVVTGLDTKFTKDLRQGDALLIRREDTGQDEMRVITMLLSDISINLSSPFSVNLTKPSTYRFIPKPRNKTRETKQAREKAAREAIEEEARASGTGAAAAQELVYRERTAHGSYRIRRKQLDGEASREELLNLRAKKTSDKYC